MCCESYVHALGLDDFGCSTILRLPKERKRHTWTILHPHLLSGCRSMTWVKPSAEARGDGGKAKNMFPGKIAPTSEAPRLFFFDLAPGGKTQETPGEHQNRWQMDVYPPQNGAIGYAPWQFDSQTQNFNKRNGFLPVRGAAVRSLHFFQSRLWVPTNRKFTGKQ